MSTPTLEEKQQRLKLVNEKKEEGNKLFGQHDYEAAQSAYEHCLQILAVDEFEQTPEETKTSEEQTDGNEGSVATEVETEEEATTSKQEEVITAPPVELSKEEEKYLQDRKEIEVTLRSNLAACLLQREQFERVVEEASRALILNNLHLKSLYRRAKAYHSLKKYDEAIKDYQQVLEMSKQNKEKPQTIYQLESTIATLSELRKKQVEEEMSKMWGQLKELGNTILSPFGIDLNNIKFQKDQRTGSYSVQYGNGGSSSSAPSSSNGSD